VHDISSYHVSYMINVYTLQFFACSLSMTSLTLGVWQTLLEKSRSANDNVEW
jgi:hypothetical protein